MLVVTRPEFQQMQTENRISSIAECEKKNTLETANFLFGLVHDVIVNG